jgi:hypothetical protein
MFTKQFFVRPLAWAMIVLLAAPPAVLTQQPAAPPTQQPAAPPTFKQEELDQILAPIALYPDSLIAQILMASTFPLEVVQAERFGKQNASLKGEALTKALESQSWDPSVKSLVNFPQVLTMMNDKLDWTQKLGEAFLGQQKPVLDTIQRLRAKAHYARCQSADMSYPVILDAEDNVLDGLHRLVRAVAEGAGTIQCVRIHDMPAPDAIEREVPRGGSPKAA